MSFVFFITLFFLAAIAYTIYRKQQHASGSDYELRAAPPRTLFGEVNSDDQLQTAGDQAAPGDDARAALLARASQGDCTALDDAGQTGDAAFYGSTLGALLQWAGASPEHLRELASFVATGQDLRGSVGLSRAYSLLWEQTHEEASTVRALHLAALSDDAEEFSRVVELIVRLRRENRLTAVSGDDLCALVENEFWVLGAGARASGAGFVLKQKLAVLRGELTE